MTRPDATFQAIKGYAKEELLTPLKRTAKKLQNKIHDRFTTDQQKEEINKKLAKLKREETNVLDLTGKLVSVFIILQEIYQAMLWFSKAKLKRTKRRNCNM